MEKYDTLLWDVDGTLLNFLASERYAIMEVFRLHGIEIDEEIIQTYSRINEFYWKKLEKREVDKVTVLRGRFLSLFEEFANGKSLGNKGIDFEQMKQIDVDAFRGEYQRLLGSVYFYQDDSLTLCKRLKEKGLKQYIITNGVTWSQKNKLTLAGFYDVMDGIFISEEIGFHKPDIRFYEEVFKRMEKQANPGRMLIIGDSQTSDMQLARDVKLDCCLYTNGKGVVETSDETRVTYQISNLWEIEKILSKG